MVERWPSISRYSKPSSPTRNAQGPDAIGRLEVGFPQIRRFENVSVAIDHERFGCHHVLLRPVPRALRPRSSKEMSQVSQTVITVKEGGGLDRSSVSLRHHTYTLDDRQL